MEVWFRTTCRGGWGSGEGRGGEGRGGEGKKKAGCTDHDISVGNRE